MARPMKFEDARPQKLTITVHPDVRERLERAAALLGAREGKRLSIGDALKILLDESESLERLGRMTGSANAPAAALPPKRKPRT